MTAEPFDISDAWTPEAAVARVLDLITLAERVRPAWRYVSVAELRQAITEQVKSA